MSEITRAAREVAAAAEKLKSFSFGESKDQFSDVIDKFGESLDDLQNQIDAARAIFDDIVETHGQSQEAEIQLLESVKSLKSLI